VFVFTAEQLVVPPLLSHVQIHWPVPSSTTLLAKLPGAHKFAVGCEDDGVPLAAPHEPVEGGALLTGAVQFTGWSE
jgi:hypothetical protein